MDARLNEAVLEGGGGELPDWHMRRCCNCPNKSLKWPALAALAPPPFPLSPPLPLLPPRHMR